MSTGYQINDQEGLYYLTYQIIDWNDIFTQQVYRDMIIDNNPVRAGIVEKPEDYMYSGARYYAGLDCILDVSDVGLPWRTV